MKYSKFNDEIKLSALGMGAMRLPTIWNESDGPIDETATEKMIELEKYIIPII